MRVTASQEDVTVTTMKIKQLRGEEAWAKLGGYQACPGGSQ